MLLPSADQYSLLIEKKDPRSFTFLNDYTFLPKESGAKEYIHYKGNNTVVFKAVKGNQKYAVRCFLVGDRETFRRYDERARFLADKNLSWKLPLEYFENEIFFEGQQYPVVVMDWAEGQTLHSYLDSIVYDAVKITRLQEKFIALSKSMEDNGIGHGDLNFSHILIQQPNNDPQLRLIDYDSIFIPAFQDLDSQHPGTPGFQHPRRLATDFSERIDRFSFWILLTGLEAIKQDPSLWKDSGFRSNRHFFFTLRDLIYPDQSKLIQRLRSYGSESLSWYVDQVVSFCRSGALSEITAPQLFKKGMARATEQQPSSSVRVDTSTGAKDKKKEQPEAAGGPDEILEFGADKNSIREGEPITIYWKVNGNGKIHITNIGEINEAAGRKKLTLKQTTSYILTVGSKSRSLTIHVSPRPVRPIHTKNDVALGSQVIGDSRKANNVMKWVGIGLALVIGAFILVNSISKDPDQEEASKVLSANQDTARGAKAPSYTKETVTRFLDRLYTDYNLRSLPDIMENYAPSINEYYDSRSIGNDSLSRIIHNLFIVPQYYQCQPDYSTLQIKSSGNSCIVIVTIRETIQNTVQSKRENYSTRIQYVLDKDMKVVAEKSAG